MKKLGSAPEEGNTRVRPPMETAKMRSTASQNDGVAIPAMDITRMIWSGHLSRYSADITPSVNEKIAASSKPKNVSCMVMGRADAMAVATGV